MNKPVAEQQIVAMKKKLDAAIQSRGKLEEDFSTQSSLLIQFINKLSLISKGVDLELDNRLAQLRTLFSKSAAFAEIEDKIQVINKILQQYSITNEQNINRIHEQFNSSGESLQKINGLPADLRRNLRALLKETDTTKDALIQYVPLLSQLLELYGKTLANQSAPPKEGLLQALNSNAQEPSTPKIDSSLIEKITEALGALNLSKEHTNNLQAIKKKLLNDKSNEEVLEHFLEIFDLIVADFKDEQQQAKRFLTNLSETLTTVQNAVKETLNVQQKSQKTNDKINHKLQKQLTDMTGTVSKALSLNQVKNDINDKLQIIAGTLEQKTKFEQQNQQLLAKQLQEMSDKVAHLEKQSKVFEEKLAAQQQKSMQDALTKLGNRAAFDDYFAKAMVRYHHQPYELAIVVIDIDDFKLINDTYGHSAGDKTLQVIAKTIQKNASKKAFVARYGGEEFVLIYSETNASALVNELNLINKHVARLPFKFKNNKVCITLSMGATHIHSEDNIHIAFERADQAMYQAKSQGKNQVIYQE
ncbi:GGDEF domain-containing protein [Colwellia sp. RSH04]|uniref:GGDEF domain-containing protein n=1 Tax=Colwellia sp. RSH04 TaxID=2305464 RepID=UPI000E573C13|nr:GGDEF domain-containing protein [Colwellia sp. RSH04]RHW75446.1 GGDEF domain-containing protein [Colwellia sp. RSH04]